MRGFTLLKRELSLHLNQGSGISLILIFFLSIIILFPFSIGPNMKQLGLLAPAIIWCAAILSILLGMEKIFQPDAEDGTLDIYRLSNLSMESIILIKALAYWLSCAFPLIILTPIFGAMLGMDNIRLGSTILSLLIGTPALVFLGTICTALTTRLRRSAILVAVLAIPLLIPVLIFGVSLAANTGTKSQFALYLLLALTLFSGVIAVVAGAQILKHR